ncbi:MAG TPA: hypothetical protein DIT84_08085 [Clostridiales bacterium]|nr:hypothetical protein [Clostridiales bacterium]
MKNSKVLYLLLTLAMCLSLAACGGGDEGITTPAWFEGMVSDSQNKADFNLYGGTWTGDNGSMVVEMSESGDEVRFALYDANNEITASGFIQTEPQYNADYFYNEHDGVAHLCSVPGDVLTIDGFGEFTKVSGDKQDDTVGGDDYSAIAGEWYLDGEQDALSVIEIRDDGSWSLMELMDGDSERTAVDWGKLQTAEGEGAYSAVSDNFEDVAYDMTVVDGTTFYWGGENDNYQKLS